MPWRSYEWFEELGVMLSFFWLVMSSLYDNILWKYEKNPALTTYFLLLHNGAQTDNSIAWKNEAFQWEHCVGTVLVQRASASDAGWSNKTVSATMQCDVIGKSHIGLTKILKTKQYNITTNSKVTPESTPLNTISTEVNIIWKKDLLQGCGRDH